MTKDEALKLALEALEQSNQSASEIRHARNNPQWFTKGESGAYQHQQLWIARHIEATDERIKAINAIKEALAQPEPQWTPVEIGVDVTNEGAHVVGTYVLPDVVRYVFYSKLHPAPQREWVGLTDEEYKNIRYGSDESGERYVSYTSYDEGGYEPEIEIYVDDFARAIEAKLKEKNGC